MFIYKVVDIDSFTEVIIPFTNPYICGEIESRPIRIFSIRTFNSLNRLPFLRKLIGLESL